MHHGDSHGEHVFVNVALLCGVFVRLHLALFSAGGPFLPSLSVNLYSSLSVSLYSSTTCGSIGRWQCIWPRGEHTRRPWVWDRWSCVGVILNEVVAEPCAACSRTRPPTFLGPTSTCTRVGRDLYASGAI
jgi:hypothetical protein